MNRISHSYQLSRLVGATSGTVDAGVLMGKRPLLPPKLTVFASVTQVSQLTEIESYDLTLIIEAGYQDPVSALLPSWLCKFNVLHIENRAMATVCLRGTLSGQKLSLFRICVDAKILACSELSIDESESIVLKGQADFVKITGRIVVFSSLPDWFRSLELVSDMMVKVNEFYRGGFAYSFHNIEADGSLPACRYLSLSFDDDSIQQVDCPLLERLVLKNVALSGNFARVKCLQMDNAAVSKMPNVDVLELVNCEFEIPTNVKSLKYEGNELPELPDGLTELALTVPVVVPDKIYGRNLWSLDLSGCLSSINEAGERVIPESNAKYLVPPEPMLEYRLTTKNLLLDAERWDIIPNITGLPTFEDVEKKLAALIVD
jgi:hypothetical protein